MLVQTPEGPKTLKKLTWEMVAVIGMAFAFIFGVLFITAQHFDKTEWKSIVMLTAGSAAREIVPFLRYIRRALVPTTEAFSRGGQVE